MRDLPGRIFLFTIILFAALTAWAQWPENPAINLAICTATGEGRTEDRHHVRRRLFRGLV